MKITHKHTYRDSLAIRLEICQPPSRIYAISKKWRCKANDSKKANTITIIFDCILFMSATNQNACVAFIKLFAICVLSLSSSSSQLLRSLISNAFRFHLFQSRNSYLLRDHRHCCHRHHHHRLCHCRPHRSNLVHAISDPFSIAIVDCNLFVYRIIITSPKWMPHCC